MNISCKKFYSAILFTSFSYTSHTILSFYIIYTFDFAFKCTPTSLFLIKTHLINLIYLVFTNFIINVIMCLIFHTYFFVLLQDDIMNCMLNYSTFPLLSYKFILSCRLLPAVFSRALAYLLPDSPKTLH